MALTPFTAAPWSMPAATTFGGEFIAADPTVLRDGALWRMFYTDGIQDAGGTQLVIAQAVSTDGLTWTQVGGNMTDGIVVSGPGGDMANLEAACIFKAGDTYVLLFSAYADSAGPLSGFPAALYAAVSNDGLNYAVVGGGPVLAPTSGWYDNEAIYSPTVVAHDGGYLMLYCGHAYVDATAVGGDIGVRLLAATSTDGITWTKHDAPLLGADAALTWMSDGVAEPSMVQGPDGKWYLFFTGLHGDERAIGIAVAADPLGPWDVEPQPIITAASLGLPAGSRTVAPEAELVDGTLRLWFGTVSPDGQYSISYAEADWGGGPYAPATFMPHWLGTELDDSIEGTAGADSITAGDGNDYVAAGAGDDTIVAGDGDDTVLAGDGRDSVLAGAGADIVWGNDGANVIDGGDGADRISGEAGNDLLRGGTGDDSIDAGDGADTLLGGTDNDEVWAGAGNDSVLGEAGDDLLYGGSGRNTLDGGAGADVLVGDVDADVLRGDIGDDALYGAGGADLLLGGDGLDVLDGDVGDDTLDGGAGDDQITGGAGADLLKAGDGRDVVDAGDGNDTVDGGAEDDDIWGQDGADSLLGGAGNDILHGGAGANTLDGGDGADILVGGVDGDVLLGGAGADLVVAGAGADRLDGGGDADNLQGEDGDDTIAGGAGADVLVGGAGTDAADYGRSLGVTVALDGSVAGTGDAAGDILDGIENLIGSATGSDRLIGDAGANRLEGGGGNDTLTGGQGADTMLGGTGNDRYSVDSTADLVIEGANAGTDIVQTSVSFTLGANVENIMVAPGTLSGLALTGNVLNNQLTGGAGADALNGGAGADTMAGGAGNDSYFVDSTTDVVTEAVNAGIDTVRTKVSFTLSANVEGLLAIAGTTAALVLTGNASNNTLGGGGGADTLNGGAGNDILIGGAGSDSLLGGIGNDAFVFNSALNASTNVDRINGFSALDDTIHLENAIMSGLGAGTGGLAAAAFRSAAGATMAGDADDRIIYNVTTGDLYYDADGLGGAASIRFAVIENKPALTAADFLIV